MKIFFTEMSVITILLTLASYLGTGEITARHTAFLLAVGLVVSVGSKVYDFARVKYHILVVSLFMVAASLFIIRYLTPDILRVWEVNTYVAYVIAIANLVAFVLSLITINKIGLAVRCMVIFVAIMPIMIVWGHFISNGVWISADAIVAILQTNPGEMLDYLYDVVGIKNIVLILILGGVFSYFIASFTQYRVEKITVKKIGVMLLFCILNITLLIRTSDNMLTEHWIEAMDYTDKFREFQQHQQERASNVNQSISLLNKGDNGIYVLVIGEAQTRDHMSAFGYARKTTPWLDAMKDDKHAVLFHNSYSSYCQTVRALSYALTTKNQYNDLDLSNSISLVEMANAAGYHTVWISNQVKYSMYDTPTTIIAESANERYWINNHVGETFSTNYFDDEVVKKLDTIDYSGKMLVILHFMGNHISYQDRYPKEFEYFSGSELPGMDYYDNSILYNDYVMEMLINKLQSLPNFQCMMYVADHGEGASVDMSHDPDHFIWEMARIPMYIVMSDNFMAIQPNKVNNLERHSAEYFTNDLVIDTMLGIMGIIPQDYDITKNNISGSEYDSTPERFKTMYGEFSLIDNTGDNVTEVRRGK